MTMTIMDTEAEASARPVSVPPGALLHAQVADLLDELGRQPAAVAAAELAADGYRGVPGSVMHPVARWLVAHLAGRQALAALDGPTAWVLPDGLYVVLDEVAALVPLPTAVAQLAYDFDAGHYPELVLDWHLVRGAAGGGVDDPGLGWPVVHLRPPADGLTHCTECYCTEITSCEGGCRWADEDDVLAAGLDPMTLGDVCTACLSVLAAAADAQSRAHAEAALPPAPAEGREDEVVLPATGRATPGGSHTAQLPIIRPSTDPAGDDGRVLVHVAVACGLLALAAFAAAAGRSVAGAVIAGLWLACETVAAHRRRRRAGPYPARHRHGVPRAGVAARA